MSNASNAAHPRRVLLAEDQPGSRDLITLVLSNLGYLVTPAATLGTALEVLDRGACACALLSSTLPDGAGAEAVRQIRSRGAPGRAPVVLVLGGEDPELRKAYLEAGAQAYLLRPVEIERLLRLLKHDTAARDGGARRIGPEEPAVDLEHLFGFTDGDPQLERELAALYLSSTEVYLGRMQTALQSGADWQGTAHALKGASGNLGARRVATLALAAERSGPSEAVLSELRQAVGEVRSFFDDRSPSR